MKKLFVFILSVLVMSCSNNDFDTDIVKNSDELVTLTFSQYEMKAMTRGTAITSDISSNIDVWIVEGNNVIDVHQTSSDENFGSVTVTLDKTKTYNLYVIAHKAGGAGTYNDGVISFPDDKVTEAYFYSTSFSPNTTNNLSCELTRIIGKFVIKTTDVLPEETAKLKFTIYNYNTTYNVNGEGGDPITKEINITIPNSYIGQTLMANCIIIPDSKDASCDVDIKVSILKSDNSIIQERTFENVPIRNNYTTTYSGTFFTDTSSNMSLSVSDWNSFDEVNY